MDNPYASLEDKELLKHVKANNQTAFSALYDRYAAPLLGVIMRIVHHNEMEASVVLEKTFLNIRAQIAQFKPEEHYAFIWLLKIGRQTAIEALVKRTSQHQGASRFTISGGQILSSASQVTTASMPPTATHADPQLKALLDAVLFKNCTLEESAVSLGIPVESARQQLRLALQQIRKAQ